MDIQATTSSLQHIRQSISWD